MRVPQTCLTGDKRALDFTTATSTRIVFAKTTKGYFKEIGTMFCMFEDKPHVEKLCFDEEL